MGAPEPPTLQPAISDPTAELLFYEAMLTPADGDPYSGYRLLRERAPALLTGDGTLVLSDHAGCDAALRHRSLGKGDELLGFQFTHVAPDVLDRIVDRIGHTMVFANPPDHTRLRRLVSNQFTAKHIQALRQMIERRSQSLIENLDDHPGADFVAEVAVPLPMHVICDLLGVPEEDRQTFLPWARAFSSFTAASADTDAVSEALAAEEEASAYFTDLIGYKRRHPGDDLISRMITARENDSLTEHEMISTAVLLFGAGFETTTNMLGNGLAALMTHPDQQARLRAGPLLPTAIDEFLRFDPPVQINARSALEPADLAGVRLAPGQMVITLLGAANRDPQRFAFPDTFDIGRTDNPHLSFASGIHFCLGAHLTRLEGHVVFEQLLRRFTSIEPGGPSARKPGLALRGYAALPVVATR